MSRQIEIDIFRFISRGLPATEGIKRYLPQWRSHGLSSTDVNIICHFLFVNGGYQEILDLSIENIEKDDPVSWRYLSKTLQLVEPNTRAPVFQRLKDYLTEYRKMDEFTVSDLFDSFFPLDGEIKLAQIQSKIQIKERHRQTILDQIRVFNQSRNFAIEKQAIQKFIKFYPNDKAGKELLRRFEADDLQRFYQRYKNEHKTISQPIRFEIFTSQEKELLQSYLTQINKMIAAASVDRVSFISSEIKGFVYFFIFLEDYAHALELMTYLPQSAEKDWLYLDLLFLNHKYAETLAYFKYLDAVYGHEPTYFSAKVYYTAQCFWGLGERKKAIELMDNLSQLKPDYRLASSLLKDWRSDL